MITGSGHITRPTTLGNFVDFTKDWTRSQYVKFPSASTGSDFYSVWFVTDVPSDNSIELYAWLAGGVGAFSLTLDVIIATVSHSEILSTPVSTATNVYCTIRYTASTHLLEMLIDGVVVDSATLSLASISGIATDFMLSVGGGLANESVGYDGIWQRAIINSEITAQMSSITVVNSTGLITYCPLQTSIDLTAHNNTLTVFTAAGTITTNTTDPLLSVVAGPPTNTTPATALDVTIDSAFFQNVNTAGVATDVWYKYQSVSADDVLGLIGFGDLTTYKPIVLVYGSLADANANIQYQVSTTFVQTDQNRAGIFPLPNDSSTPFFYFNVVRNGAVAASTLQFSLLRALSLPVPVGSIGINHDNTQGWPLTLLDQNTGYPIHYVKNFIGGNGGCTLPNGITIFTNSNTGAVEVINAQLSIIATITPIVANFASGNLVDKFVITNTATPAPVRIVNPDGTVDPVTYSLTGNNCTALGLSRDSSIIYFIKTGANQPVKRWSVTTNTALSDLVAGISGYTCCLNEIIVLDDDSIVVNYFRTTPSKDIKIVNYSAAGATLHTYDFGPFTEFAGNQNRIAGAIDNLNQFWSWIKFTDDNSTGQFRRIKVSDGSILTFFTTIEYDFGQYQGLPINTPVRFGNPDSCPMWVVRTALFPGNNAKSGLYILTGTGGDFGLPDNPILRHDVDWIDTSLGTSENVKIPDPYYDTYLVGDE